MRLFFLVSLAVLTVSFHYMIVVVLPLLLTAVVHLAQLAHLALVLFLFQWVRCGV